MSLNFCPAFVVTLIWRLTVPQSLLSNGWIIVYRQSLAILIPLFRNTFLGNAITISLPLSLYTSVACL